MVSLDVMKKPAVLSKVLQLSLAIACWVLLFDSDRILAINFDKGITIYVTFVAFTMINVITIMSFVLDTPLHKNLLAAIALSGAAMFTATGAILVRYYVKFESVWIEEPPVLLMACGILAIVNAALYLVDTGLTLTLD